MSDTHTPVTADLSSTWSSVMADLEAEAASPASETSESSDTLQTETVVETPVEETPAPTVEATPKEEPPAEILYEFKADGEVRKVSLDELTRLASAGAHATRRQMEAAEKERQLQAWYQKTHTDLQAQLSDKAFLEKQYQQILEREQAAAQTENAQRPVQQQLPREEIARIAAEQAQAVIFQNELTHWKQNTQADISRHTTDLINKHPLLQTVEDIDILIRRDAGKRVNADTAAGKVTPLEDVKRYLEEAATTRVAKLEKQIKDREQAAIMRHAKAQKPAIEPKGGSIPAVQSAPKFKWGDGGMAKSIEQELRAAQQK
jgi:hypothetical protein